MRAFTALVWHEISERRALLAAAAVASVLPVLAPLVPSTGSNPAADVRELVMWIMVGFLVPLFALLLGVSFIGRDLSEGRLGFYYAQPLSGPTIWFGKLTAVFLLVWGAQALIMLPTVLLAPNPVRLLAPVVTTDLPWKTGVFGWSVAETFGPYATLAVWLVPLGIVLLGHAVSVVWRGRSVWLVLDLIALLVVAGGAWMALRPFLPQVALKAALAGVLWIVAWVFLGLIAAGAAQLTFGRVDLRRAHRSLSAALWAVLAVAVGALLGWSNWVRSATPGDLHRVDRVSVASGEWIAVSGPSDGRLDYHPRFILNANDGRWVRAGSGPQESWYMSDIWFSGDGRHAFWGKRSLAGELDLMYVNLEEKEPHAKGLGLVLDGDHRSRMDVSNDGDRIAILEERTIAVYDVETGDQLAAVVINGEFEPDYCWFEGPGTVAIAASTPWVRGQGENEGRWTTYRFDVTSKTLSRGEEVTGSRWGTAEKLVAQNRRRVERVESEAGDTLALVDAGSGELVADLGETHRWSWDVRDLGDGRFLVLRHLDDESFLDYFDADGIRLNRVGYGRGSWLRFAGEVAPGRLMLGAEVWDANEREETRYRFSIVNTATGLAETTMDGFYPLQGQTWRGIEAVGDGAWQVGSVASRLLQGEDGSLHLLDPETGTLKQLIPAVASSSSRVKTADL